jgi:hypothetical protein
VHCESAPSWNIRVNNFVFEVDPLCGKFCVGVGVGVIVSVSVIIVTVSVTVIFIVTVSVSVSVKLTSSVVGGVDRRSSEKLEGIDGCIVKS